MHTPGTPGLDLRVFEPGERVALCRCAQGLNARLIAGLNTRSNVGSNAGPQPHEGPRKSGEMQRKLAERKEYLAGRPAGEVGL